MKKYIILFFISITTILLAQEDFTVPMTPSKDQQLDIVAKYGSSLSKFDRSPKAYAQLKYCISILDSRKKKDLKEHPAYSTLGDVYMYGAIYLQKEYKEEKIIEMYNKALELRGDPNSYYSLAIIYKNKYDNAIKNNDTVKEVEYGKKVYDNFDKFVLLSGSGNVKKYKDILNYFKTYK